MSTVIVITVKSFHCFIRILYISLNLLLEAATVTLFQLWVLWETSAAVVYNPGEVPEPCDPSEHDHHPGRPDLPVPQPHPAMDPQSLCQVRGKLLLMIVFEVNILVKP